MLTASASPASLEYTDLSRWRLRNVDGRQTWHYLSEAESAARPQNDVDKYWLDLELNAPELPKPTTALDAARNGLTFYQRLQCEDGHFAGAYGGPHFLTPGYVITMYISKQVIPQPMRVEMIRYLLKTANKPDGGWGIHVAGESTVFGTAMNYVTCRLLGLEADHPAMVLARGTLHKLGSATAAPAWGKFWLSVLGVYEYEGMNPVPPELWLLPYALPFHPGRWWIHTRMVYLPMSFIYAQRLKGDDTPLLRDLREELYVQSYNSIPWTKQCNNVAAAEVFYPHTRLLDGLNGICWMYEKLAPRRLRKWAVDEAWLQLQMEDKNTDYGNLASVNKPLNMLCTYFALGRESKEFKLHKEHCLDYIWMSESGMHFNGTDGSQVWDTAFFSRAMCEIGLAKEPKYQKTMTRALDFLDTQQIRVNPENNTRCYRDLTKGAWPFSRRSQGYTVSDCTAEAMKAVLMLQDLPYLKRSPVTPARLREAADIMLHMQNADGGFATYELTRGPKVLEWINPAEVFGDIMLEYSYPECTTAVLLALNSFAKAQPGYREAEIEVATERGIRYIKDAQREDGSWFGSWAICFVYATWFGIEGLAAVGETYENSATVRRACEFLIGKQKVDGGWGEDYKSCETGMFHHHATSQVVHTAWAVLALLAAKYPDASLIARGVALLAARQQPDGRWHQEAIEGVFNRNALIAYPNYKFVFPIWALGRWEAVHGPVALSTMGTRSVTA
ncbi:Lanosterol synthase (Oxidosqualene--lanosterol cyclase) [Thoreauomyces humboldtii]|nr:Lanosterol synthase (Oxidosqualene--lanosterol cyclase) [Thoreauomyces humboldtii]